MDASRQLRIWRLKQELNGRMPENKKNSSNERKCSDEFEVIQDERWNYDVSKSRPAQTNATPKPDHTLLPGDAPTARHGKITLTPS